MQSKDKMQKSWNLIWFTLANTDPFKYSDWPWYQTSEMTLYNANMPRFSMYTIYQGHHLSFHVLIYTKQIIDWGRIELTLVLQVFGNRPKY